MGLMDKGLPEDEERCVKPKRTWAVHELTDNKTFRHVDKLSLLKAGTVRAFRPAWVEAK
jgi:hypothetical protein